MRPPWRSIALALAFGAAAVCAAAQPSQLSGVASVIDGDTIEIHGQRVRLDGFDAPERGRRCAGGVNAYQRASLALSEAIARRTVTCIPTGRDRARIVARCAVGGADLGALMVRGGWARDWPRYSGGRYASAEQDARRMRRGVWGMECPGLWGAREYG